MEGAIAPPTKEQYLEALNAARARYDQALVGEGLRAGEDRWQVLDEMNQAMSKAKRWLGEQGIVVSYSLTSSRYEVEEAHGASAVAVDAR